MKGPKDWDEIPDTDEGVAALFARVAPLAGWLEPLAEDAADLQQRMRAGEVEPGELLGHELASRISLLRKRLERRLPLGHRSARPHQVRYTLRFPEAGFVVELSLRPDASVEVVPLAHVGPHGPYARSLTIVLELWAAHAAFLHRDGGAGLTGNGLLADAANVVGMGLVKLDAKRGTAARSGPAPRRHAWVELPDPAPGVKAVLRLLVAPERGNDPRDQQPETD